MEDKKSVTQKKEKDATKLTTSKLATQLGLKTNELNKKLVLLGYLEKKNKDFHLTPEGKKAGGTTKSTGARAYILWDASMLVTLKEPMA
jgi:hypothetical protein